MSGNGWSIHAYWIAMDINWQLNPYGGSMYHMPYAMAAAICRIRTNNGKQVWNWGGFWRGTRDWMHFEIVCSPRDLATGINWSTVPGKPVGNVPKPPNEPVQQEPVPEEIPEEDRYEEEDEMYVLKDHNDQYWLIGGLQRTKIHRDEAIVLQGSWLPYRDMGRGAPYHNPLVSQTLLQNLKEVDNFRHKGK